jgi:hypothetical protein
VQWAKGIRENPDGFPSSPGASRAAAPIPVYRWDLFKRFLLATQWSG